MLNIVKKKKVKERKKLMYKKVIEKNKGRKIKREKNIVVICYWFTVCQSNILENEYSKKCLHAAKTVTTKLSLSASNKC